MRVFAAEAGEHDTPFVRMIVAIGVFEMQQMRLLADVDAAIAAEDGAAHVEAFNEHGALVGLAVVVGVFEDDDAVLRDLRMILAHRVQRVVLRLTSGGHGMVFVVLRFNAEGVALKLRAVRIFVAFHDPQAATMIPGHRDRIHDHRLMRKAAHLVAFGHAHFRTRVLGRRTDGGSGCAFAFDFFAGGKSQRGTAEKEQGGKQEGLHAWLGSTRNNGTTASLMSDMVWTESASLSAGLAR